MAAIWGRCDEAKAKAAASIENVSRMKGPWTTNKKMPPQTKLRHMLEAALECEEVVQQQEDEAIAQGHELTPMSRHYTTQFEALQRLAHHLDAILQDSAHFV